jgi:hypothetical protein
MLLVRAAPRVLALGAGVGARRVLVALLACLDMLFVRAAASVLAFVLLFLDAATVLTLGARVLMALLAGLHVLLMRAALISRHFILLVSGMVAANSIHGRPKNAA